MKKILALLLVLVMVVGMAACGTTPSTNPSTPSTPSTPSDPSTPSEPAEVNIDELPTLNVLFVHGYMYEDYDTNVIWPELAKKVGAKIHFIGAETDKINSMLASGEGWDMIIKVGDYQATAETGAVVALSDYKDQLPNVYANMPDAVAWSAENLGDGTLYWIPSLVCPNAAKVGEMTAARGQIRWDLYADMGYPEVNTPEEQAQLLIDMVEKYPTGPNGKPAYAHCIPTDVMWNHLKFPFVDWTGYNSWSGSDLALYSWEDLSYMNFLDPEEGAYWDAIDYYHTLYQAGALDPDSFTMLEADMKTKATAGNLYSVFASWQYAAADLPEGTGFMAIPMTKATTAYMEELPKTKGTGTPSWAYGVNVNTEYLDECLAYLDFLASWEGANLVVNGIEGVHYTTDADGVRSLTDAAWALKDQGNEAWEKYGLYAAEVGNITLYDSNALMADGKPLNLSNDPAFWTSKLTDIEKAFCDHYDVVYPGEYYAKVMKDNNLTMATKPTAEEKASFTAPSDDIKQIENGLKLEAETWAATLIMASDAEYEKLIADAKAAFAAAGLADVDAYYNAQ